MAPLLMMEGIQESVQMLIIRKVLCFLREKSSLSPDGPDLVLHFLKKNARKSILYFKKMSPLKYWTTVICTLFIAIGAASNQEVKVYGEVGGTVSFGATSLNPPVSSIIWKHRSSTGYRVIKAIEWDVEDGFSAPNPRFQGITTLDKITGEITITNLNVDHSGLYNIDINSKEQEQRFKLEVLAQLPKPVIKIEKIKVNPDAVYLICEYSETIIWKNSTGGTLQGSPHSPKGELIKVEKQGNPDFFYTCTLENALRNSTSDPVYERDLFKDVEEDTQPEE